MLAMSAVYEIRPSDKMRTIEHHLPPQMVYRAGETQQHLYTWIHTKYVRGPPSADEDRPLTAFSSSTYASPWSDHAP